MINTFQPLIRDLAVILSVFNFEFRSLEFVWDLWFDAWDFLDSPYASNFIDSRPLSYKMMRPWILKAHTAFSGSI